MHGANGSHRAGRYGIQYGCDGPNRSHRCHRSCGRCRDGDKYGRHRHNGSHGCHGANRPRRDGGQYGRHRHNGSNRPGWIFNQYGGHGSNGPNRAARSQRAPWNRLHRRGWAHGL